MALSEHELLHLNAVIVDAQTELEKPMNEKEQVAEKKELPDYDVYLQKVIDEATAIIKADAFPEDLRKPSDIHDYLETSVAEAEKSRG